MISFALAFHLHVNAVVGHEKRRDAIVFSLFGRFRVDGRKQFEYAGRNLNLLFVLFACRRRCTPTLKGPFLKLEAPVLAFKEPENEPKTIQFLKILLEKPAPRTAPLSHNTFTFHALLIRKSPTKILPTGL